MEDDLLKIIIKLAQLRKHPGRTSMLYFSNTTRKSIVYPCLLMGDNNTSSINPSYNKRQTPTLHASKRKIASLPLNINKEISAFHADLLGRTDIISHLLYM